MTSKRTAARMTRVVARWRASGESGAGVARRHRIPAWTFWYWCRKRAADRSVESPGPVPATFVPVRVAPESDAPVIEILFSSGERLQVRAGAPPEVVRAVLTAVRAVC